MIVKILFYLSFLKTILLFYTVLEGCSMQYCITNMWICFNFLLYSLALSSTNYDSKTTLNAHFTSLVEFLVAVFQKPVDLTVSK